MCGEVIWFPSLKNPSGCRKRENQLGAMAAGCMRARAASARAGAVGMQMM